VGSANFVKYRGIKNLATWFFTNILMDVLSAALLNIKIIKICVGDYFAD
jgi:hypothetical protein